MPASRGRDATVVPRRAVLRRWRLHHHVAVNIWAQCDDVQDGATGLVAYRLRVPADGVARLREHLRSTGVAFADDDGALVLTDPVGAESYCTTSSHP